MGRKPLFALVLALLSLLLVTVGHNIACVYAPVVYRVRNLDTDLYYATIQDAIDATETLDGHRISVGPAVYYEHVTVDKALTLTGENRDTTVIDGNGTGTVVLLVANASVANFTIRNGLYGVEMLNLGFTPQYSGNTINNSKITDNLYGAIFIRGCANNTAANNIISSNTLFGIHLWNAGNNTIVNNTVLDNGHGIDFYGNSNDNVLRSNNMTDNVYNFGLILRGDTRNFLSGTLSKTGIVNDVDASNTVDGKPIYYWIDRADAHVPPDAGYVWLNNCTNITVDRCNLSNNLQGVLLLFANNVSITNENITNNAYGVYVGIYSSNNTISADTLENNLNGVYLDDFSKFTTMRNNSIRGGQMNFGVSPDEPQHLEDSSKLVNDIDTSNTVDGKPIVYWINQHDQRVPTDAGYVMLINSSRILVENLNLSNNVQNVFLLSTNDTVISNNSVTNSIYGIDVSGISYLLNSSTFVYQASYNTTVEGNTLVDNGVGLRIRSDMSAVKNNTLNRNPLGIYLKGTSNSTVSKNAVTASDLNMTYPGHETYIFYYPEWPWERSIELVRMNMGGIIVGGSQNVVYGNTVSNSRLGISIDVTGGYQGSGNTIFNNNVINSTGYQAIGWRGNYWDNNYPSGGNYWSNYNGTDFHSGPNQSDAGSDGIGDESFVVFPGTANGIIDNYPLMAPISTFDVGPWNGLSRDVSIISNSTISNFRLDKEMRTISLNVTGLGGEGFCRVAVPNVILQGLWQGNITVLVNGVEVELRAWTDEENTYLFFTYQHSTKTVTILPEFPLFLVLPLITVVALTGVAVHKRRHKF